ncbi:MAG: class I SAM-dependent RNA methyltransferase [Acidobacteria bacterium]|nr:MAG: class I SAM-dependent RNA methyltransferase [Acidobacteriota bacterium]
MPLSPKSEITLTIEKPVSGGRMLARHEGQIVLVAGAIPGERVRARVERVSKHMAFADTIEVLDPSADRRAGGVDWACGGSLYAHIAYERQLTLKSEVVRDAFERIAKMRLPEPVAVMPSEEHGYRMRARLHGADGRLGFFREGTHELCDAGPTRQLLPESIAALERLRAAFASQAMVSCELVENAAADERAVLVELDRRDITSLHDTPIEGISGLLFAAHHDTHQTVGYGSPFVTDRVPVADRLVVLTHHVQSFFQANRYLLPRLVDRVLRQVPDGTVTELYAGVGLFAVSLAALDRRGIVAVEGDRSSARDLDSNAAAHGAAIRVEHMSVETYLQRPGAERPDTIVIDPPRTGLSREAMSGVLGLRAPRVVYLSCDAATLARDTRRFVESGYSLEHIEAFDLFPNTAHVETLAVFST